MNSRYQLKCLLKIKLIMLGYNKFIPKKVGML